MFRNYLLLALKSFKKQKLFSLINILGLTIGITCCLMIFLFIRHEMSFDSFHKNENSIYRIVRQADINGTGTIANIAYVSGPYAVALKNDYPDAIKRAVRVMPDNDLFTYNQVAFNERGVYIADSDFFQIFDFPLLQGNPSTVLKEPKSIVLTAYAAKKYFGSQDPMGKIIEMNKSLQLKVTGIAKDPPSNSHLNFDIIVPIANFKIFDSLSNFPNNGMYTYVQLNPNVDPKQLVSRFPQFMKKYMGEFYAKSGFKMDLGLEAMKDIYFESGTHFDSAKHGNKKMIYIFMSIAILILVIACINFMNLATARATDRSKEVGLRKVLGAVRKQLVWQFILESFLYAIFSCILAVGLLQLLLPAYTSLLGYQLPPYWKDPVVYLFLLSIILIIGVLAGIYPALLLSSFSPVESLKGKLRTGKGSAFFRKALVVFQFGVSVLLIICITIITIQMNYVRNKDLGFNKEQTMLIKIDNNDIYNERLRFKNTIQRIPNVMSVSLMCGEPGGFHDNHTFETEAKPGQKLLINTEFADFEFVKTLGLKIIAGRDFSPIFPTDSSRSVLISRSTASLLGYTPDQAIGKSIRNAIRDSIPRKIVGVVEDYHYASLKESILPVVISTAIDWRMCVIRLRPTDHLSSVISNIQKEYTSAAPGYPFEYTFLDDEFNKHYQDDIKQGIILRIFSALAIFIACLGLFGLASYTAIKRTKEIGVRKVLGSSIQNIIFLLSKDLLKPVMLGTIIAIPAGFWIMNKWLEGFAYKITISWWMFLLAALTAILIALITVSYQAMKAALANPIKSLRTE